MFVGMFWCRALPYTENAKEGGEIFEGDLPPLMSTPGLNFNV